MALSLGAMGDTGYTAIVSHVAALCMGASTYEWMRRHQETVTATVGRPWPYVQPAWVFTHRALPRIADAAELPFVQGDIRPEHEAMMHAAAGNDVWIVGGAVISRDSSRMRACGTR